jgi:hypothetical protein
LLLTAGCIVDEPLALPPGLLDLLSPLPLPWLLSLLLLQVLVLKLLPLLHQVLPAAMPGASTANRHPLLFCRVTQCHAG